MVNKTLPNIRNYLYDEVEKRWWWSIYLSALFIASSLIVVIFDWPKLAVFTGFATLISPLGVIWLREWASNYNNKADKCRRLILYADALNYEIPADEEVKIKAWVTGVDVKEAFFIAPYYDSQFSPGPNRLLDILAESSFFTSHLSKKVLNYLSIILILTAIIAIVLLYFGSNLFVECNYISTLAKSASIFIPLLYFGDFAILWRKFFIMRSESEKVFRDCARMKYMPTIQQVDAIQLVEDYHLLINQSPPIPSFLYKREVRELNELYRNSQR